VCVEYFMLKIYLFRVIFKLLGVILYMLSKLRDILKAIKHLILITLNVN